MAVRLSEKELLLIQMAIGTAIRWAARKIDEGADIDELLAKEEARTESLMKDLED